MRGLIIGGGLALLLGCGSEESDQQVDKNSPAIERTVQEEKNTYAPERKLSEQEKLLLAKIRAEKEKLSQKEMIICRIYPDNDPRALEATNDYVAKHPANYEAHAYRGHLFYVRKDYQKAISDCTNSIQIEDNADARWTRHKAYQALFQIDENKENIENSLADLDQYIKLSPRNGSSRGADREKAIMEYEKLSKELLKKK